MFNNINGIAVDRLLLDPSNPRFADGFTIPEDESEIESLQDEVIRHFENRDTDSGEGEYASGAEEEKYGVNNLITSIRTIGFVPIDKPVVKKLKGTDKYVVLEGNRRVTACKIILRKHAEQVAKGLGPGPKNKDYLSDAILSSVQKIDVLELDLAGLSDEELKRRERIVLGVRHHGSLLEWEPLPKAYSIYKEYMEFHPPLEEFTRDTKRANHVRDVFTLGKQSPLRALRSYVVYRQLKDADFAVEAHHFSLLQELLSSTKLTSTEGYLSIDNTTFELSEDSLTKIDLLCQFETRDQSKQSKDDFKILKDPKSVKHLAKLVTARRDSDQAVAQFATSLLEEVESVERPLEGIEGHPLQAASDALLEFQNRRKWVEELERLLDRLESDEGLDISDFGATNDIKHLYELDKQLEVFRLVFELK